VISISREPEKKLPIVNTLKEKQSDIEERT
jgi:hypothetical protein